MGFLDRLFGGGDRATSAPAAAGSAARGSCSDDELAIERYRYLLRTAPPESIEAVHAEAFAKLTPRAAPAAVYRSLAEQAPAGRAARRPTSRRRSRARRPGRSCGQPGTHGARLRRAPVGAGDGRRRAGRRWARWSAARCSAPIAGVVIGSAIAQAFLPDPGAFEAGGDRGRRRWAAPAATRASADARRRRRRR